MLKQVVPCKIPKLYLYKILQMRNVLSGCYVSLRLNQRRRYVNFLLHNLIFLKIMDSLILGILIKP
jgi:hypothetical protein